MRIWFGDIDNNVKIRRNSVIKIQNETKANWVLRRISNRISNIWTWDN